MKKIIKLKVIRAYRKKFIIQKNISSTVLEIYTAKELIKKYNYLQKQLFCLYYFLMAR